MLRISRAAMPDTTAAGRLPYLVFTNGTNRSPAHFAAVLRDAGLDVTDDQMMTPASSAVVMFTAEGARHQDVRHITFRNSLCPRYGSLTFRSRECHGHVVSLSEGRVCE
jgi:ribonucleotide monophosphatase NagD (HAD superfamily)